jgi:hypothetical protein
MSGKEDWPRPYDKERWDKNSERIFGAGKKEDVADMLAHDPRRMIDFQLNLVAGQIRQALMKGCEQ